MALNHLNAILSDVHPHVASDYRLLGPTYRGFFVVAELLVESLSSMLGSDERTTPRPNADDDGKDYLEEVGIHRIMTMLQRASILLMRILDDVYDSVEKALLSIYVGDGNVDGRDFSVETKKWSRMIIFLLARVRSLSSMAAEVGHRTRSSLGPIRERRREIRRSSIAMMGTLVPRLVRARSISILAESISSVDDGGACVGVDRTELSKLAMELRLKSEQNLKKVLDGGVVRASKEGDASAALFLVERVLGCLMTTTTTTTTLDVDDVLLDVGTLGKLLLANYAMERVFEMVDHSEMNPPLPYPIIPIDLFKCILFVDVPKCHRLLRASSSSSVVACNLRRRAMETLSELISALENASHALCLTMKDDEESSGHHRRLSIVQQHHLLVRWLGPTASARHCIEATPNHPLMNEVLFHILHRRIMISFLVDDPHLQEDALHLISLLSKLLFHQQTEVYHRRNIATLLIRILSSSSDETRDEEQTDARYFARQYLWVGLKRSGAIDRTRRKRKRSNANTITSSLLLPDDVHSISSVMEALAKSVRIDSDASCEMRHFWHDVLSGNFRPGKGGREIDRATFILSLSVGAARMSSTLDDFFATFDPDDALSGNKSPEIFVDRVLDFIIAVMPSENKRINSRNKNGNPNRCVLLRSVCIGLINALPGFVMRDMSEAQFSRIAKILNDSAVLSASFDASVHEVRLQQITVSAASNMGNLIRSNFGERSLMVRFAP